MQNKIKNNLPVSVEIKIRDEKWGMSDLDRLLYEQKCI